MRWGFRLSGLQKCQRLSGNMCIHELQGLAYIEKISLYFIMYQKIFPIIFNHCRYCLESSACRLHVHFDGCRRHALGTVRGARLLSAWRGWRTVSVFHKGLMALSVSPFIVLRLSRFRAHSDTAGEHPFHSSLEKRSNWELSEIPRLGGTGPLYFPHLSPAPGLENPACPDSRRMTKNNNNQGAASIGAMKLWY